MNFHKLLNLFQFALCLGLMMPLCRGNIHIIFENITGPERSGLEARWSGSFDYGFYSIAFGEPDTLPSLEIGSDFFLNNPGGELAQHSVISTPAIILDGSSSFTQIDNSRITRTGYQIGFSGENIYTPNDYIQNSYFEGSLFIQDARLEDYGFRLNEEIVTSLNFNDGTLTITILPEPNTYALILGVLSFLGILIPKNKINFSLSIFKRG